MIANFWLRPGNTSASTNFLDFLEDTLEKLHGKRIGLVRMDSGFFSDQIMSTLERNELNHIIACRFNNRIKHELVYERKWVSLAPGLDIAEGTYQGLDWENRRRIIMVRQRIDERPKAAGKQIRQKELFPDVADLSNYPGSAIRPLEHIYSCHFMLSATAFVRLQDIFPAGLP